MKLFNKILIAAGVFGIVAISSCSDDKLNEIGENPNSPVAVPISLLMPQVTVDLAFGVNGTDLAWYSSVFVEHTTGVHGQLENADKRVGIDGSIGNNSWNTIYADVLSDLEVIIERGSTGAEAGSWTSVGIAKILKAYAFSVATDLWGDVPYTEALQGSANRAPNVTVQETIYEELQTLLDSAIIDLGKESIGDLESTDFYYGGDVDSWTKAAWALKARLYNRLSRRDASGSATDALDAVSNAFTSNADDMVFSSFTTAATGQNPWFQELNDRSHHAISSTFFDIVDGLSDPRADLWFGLVDGAVSPAPNGTAVTDQSGDVYSRAAYADKPSATGAVYLTATSDLPLMTYDEIKFIEAEANLRLGNATEAYDAYIEAVGASLIRAGVSSADSATYVSQPSVSVGEGALTLDEVITQKYISFWIFQSIEAYSDYRRTGIPTLTNTVSEAPQRFPYPQDEVAANPNISNINFNVPVWWAEQ